MYMDKVTEAISHFIGLFETTVEDVRLRKAYEDFKALQALKQDTPDISHETVKVNASYDLEGYNPDLPYVPLPTAVEMVTVFSNVSFIPPQIPVPNGPIDVAYPGFITPGPKFAYSGSPVLPEIDPPVTIYLATQQEAYLEDNDYIGAGGHGLRYSPGDADMTPLQEMLQASDDISPIDDLVAPQNAGEIVSFITTAADRLSSYEADPDSQATITVAKAATLQGTYVNGKMLAEGEEAPKLKDYLDLLKDEDEDAAPSVDGGESGQPKIVHIDGQASSSVELKAGGNTMVNDANISNKMLTATVTAVVGDHVELNAIVQQNFVCDVDRLGDSVNGWTLDQSDTNQAFNIAMFQRTDPGADQPSKATAADDFPFDWVVTQITGDFVVMNWVNQLSFMMDNDIAILSASGSKMMIGTGENTQLNEAIFNELGHRYDLIVVGGSMYDASIIHQRNILLDNDSVGAVNGFETNGEATASTHDNLVWNQASIHNVGGADRFETMPSAYTQAANNLAAGNKDAPIDVLNDMAFGGFGLLRVLYITGNYINLNYINQTNVLGDSDQVALAMNQFNPDTEATWTLTTGHNQLVNYASIFDLDATGKTYVGGQHYSDEVLIQAEFVSGAPDLGGNNPDILVNELVAFLDDDDIGSDGGAHSGLIDGSIVPHASQADVMQSVLG